MARRRPFGKRAAGAISQGIGIRAKADAEDTS
jgi:hypothetical protein